MAERHRQGSIDTVYTCDVYVRYVNIIKMALFKCDDPFIKVASDWVSELVIAV